MYGAPDGLEKSERRAGMALAENTASPATMNRPALSLQGRGLREEALGVYETMLSMVSDSAAMASSLSWMGGTG